jgi:hypothetical protein
MRQRKIALTGPAAAALYGLDGFREQIWPLLWCVPNGCATGDRLVQLRKWKVPVWVEQQAVAPIEVVLRHLNAAPTDLFAREDGISPIDRVELAVEHACREGTEIKLTVQHETSS